MEDKNPEQTKKINISMPLSSTNKFAFNTPEYLDTLFKSTIGNNLTFNSPFGKKSIIYTDFTASGRGIQQIEKFISEQILPFYANVHSSCGYLAEQSSAFRNEARSIVRRYCDTDENNSIIFTGQGTTGAIHKLILLTNLNDYVDFYKQLKLLNDNYQIYKENFQNNNNDLFEKLNKSLIENIKLKYQKLFNINNFCYANRWGGFDCVMCRMGFTTESQYNEHEKGDIHQNNLENNKINNTKNKKSNFIDSISEKYKISDENFIYNLIKDYELFLPIIFLSIYEHNSNSLSWRETNSKIIYINNLSELQKNLEQYKNFYIKMGTFTAASNITGKYLDVDKYSILMHKYQGLAFFDYASAAPYLKMDMNKKLSEEYRELLGFENDINNEDSSLCFKDAIFFSPHKFLGGVNTPGILLIQQRIVRNLLVPSQPGGGSVLFVTKNTQNYVKDIELREESGTPDIIGSVRVGLSIILRERLEHKYILNLDNKLNKKFMEKLSKIENLHILNDFNNEHHLPIFSFVISFNGKLFHPNYISVLLNDIFGIQSRPGCSCASTYGQFLLGISEEQIKKLEILTCTGNEIYRPGYTRINLPYWYPDYVIDYIINAIEYICKNAYKFLCLYAFKMESGRFYHRNEDTKKKWLNDILFTKSSEILIPDFIDPKDKIFISKEQLNKMFNEAIQLANDDNISFLTRYTIGKAKIDLSSLFKDHEKERWFLIFDDIENLIPITKEDLSNKNKLNIEQYYTKKLTINWNIIESYKIKNNNDNDNNTITENEEKNISNNKNNLSNINEQNLDFPDFSEENLFETKPKKKNNPLLPTVPKKILNLVSEASFDFDMLHKNDRILVCVSGGKDSLSLLHSMLNLKKILPFKIEIGAMTVNPMSEDFDPSPLINYMKSINVPYFYESDKILDNAKKSLQKNSICAFCARMKRGIIYSCARREKYNVIALGQHLDDIAESFLMSVFHNGILRTMKANYINDKGDLRIIRPLIYCREKLFKEFAINANLPVIQENCPACFQNPKERQRMKVLLAQQENLFPSLFSSIQKACIPLMKGNIADLINKESENVINGNNKRKGKNNKKKEKENKEKCDGEVCCSKEGNSGGCDLDFE